MKTLLLMLLTTLLPLAGKEPFTFPAEGKVEIEKADYFLNGDKTGGSVSVVLRDAKGTQSFVHYMTMDAGAEFGGGLLSFRAKKEEKGTTFPRGSAEEASLLKLLRSACLSSFGSADPTYLKDPKNWPGKDDGFSRMAMGSLLGHFTTPATPAAPTNADKPSN
jgi:hypothetical protein